MAIGIFLVEIKGTGIDRRAAETPIVIDVGSTVTIGRRGSVTAEMCAVFINGLTSKEHVVSGVHATVKRLSSHSWEVYDGTEGSPSTNGIWQGNQRVEKGLIQEHGDKVVLLSRVSTDPNLTTQYLAIECRDSAQGTEKADRITQRLHAELEATRQQSVENGRLLKTVTEQNQQQSSRLDKLDESLAMMEKIASFTDSVSSDGKKFRRQVFTTLALILLVTFGKVMFFDGGGKQILDAVFPPHKEQKK